MRWASWQVAERIRCPVERLERRGLTGDADVGLGDSRVQFTRFFIAFTKPNNILETPFPAC